jgi:signal transduction histidine kinase
MGEQGSKGPRRSSLRKQLAIAAALVTALTAAVAMVAAIAYVNSRDSVERRRVVLVPAARAAEEMHRALIDQETGLRGYIITADGAFLEPYVNGVVAEQRALTVLQNLLDDEPEVSGLVDAITAAAVDWRTTVALPEIDLVRTGRTDEATAMVESGIGRERFSVLRRAFDALDSELGNRLDMGGRQLTTWVAVLGTAAAVSAALTFIIAVLMWFLLRRQLSQPLERLAHEAGQVASGHLDTTITSGGPVEIDSVARSVEHMRSMLLGEVKAAFSSGMVEAEQFERARLASALHDDPIQVLSSAQWRLEAILADVPPDTRAPLQTIAASLSEVQLRLRDLMFRLHPPGLDTDGLTGALDDLLQETFADTDVDVLLDCDVDDDAPPTLAALAYRLTAEAVRNVRSHAAASEVSVVARVANGIQVTVTDDGVGFDGPPPTRHGHRGVEIGETLAAAAGGWWEIESTTHAGHGTRVSFWLPSLEATEHASVAHG